MNASPTPAFGLPPVMELDAKALDKLRELDPDERHGVLLRVLGTYETSTARILVQLHTEMHACNIPVVSRLVHTLKSSSASVGALELSLRCADVEARLREGQTDNLREDVEQIGVLGQRALMAVGAMLRS